MIDYTEHHLANCSADSMFATIADIESYPEFLPGWQFANIRERLQDELLVDQGIGLGPFHLSFTTRAYIHHTDSVVIRSQDRPFRSLELTWQTSPVAENVCDVRLSMHVQFSSMMLNRLVKKYLYSPGFNLISSFERRARSASRLCREEVF